MWRGRSGTEQRMIKRCRFLVDAESNKRHNLIMSNAQITNRTIDLGNNESLSEGVFEKTDAWGDVTYLAMTMTRSKWFKTRKGAERWYLRATGK